MRVGDESHFSATFFLKTRNLFNMEASPAECAVLKMSSQAREMCRSEARSLHKKEDGEKKTRDLSNDCIFHCLEVCR